jgi:hypothetical protein
MKKIMEALKDNDSLFKENPYLKAILINMCETVGADFNKIKFNTKKWFLKFLWTEEEENNFRNWLENYLYQEPKARKELMSLPRKNKKLIKNVVDEFLFMYGWSRV